MKTTSILYLAIFLFVCSCTMNKSSQSSENSEAGTIVAENKQNEEVRDYDQSAGMQILEKLGEVYGTAPGVDVGLSLESPNIPDFIEGIYFDNQNLVFQVSGDVSAARKELEKAAESGKFRIEFIADGDYSEKRLMKINDLLTDRITNIQDKSGLRNLMSSGVWVKERCISIELIYHTPETERDFREKIMDSPAFRFTGVTTPVVNETTGVNDTLDVSLRPEYTAYSTSDKEAGFILYNFSGGEIECGEIYFITFQDEKGVWRELPINKFFNLPAYIVAHGETRKFTAHMYPDIFPNKPGRYRFFYDVWIKGEKIQMMTEFRITDNKQELKNAAKTPAPSH